MPGTPTDNAPTAAANTARPGPTPVAGFSQQRIKRRPVLGGRLNEYERAAQKPRSRPVAQFWHRTGGR
jgi:hypothetical protein